MSFDFIYGRIQFFDIFITSKSSVKGNEKMEHDWTAMHLYGFFFNFMCGYNSPQILPMVRKSNKSPHLIILINEKQQSEYSNMLLAFSFLAVAISFAPFYLCSISTSGIQSNRFNLTYCNIVEGERRNILVSMLESMVNSMRTVSYGNKIIQPQNILVRF